MGGYKDWILEQLIDDVFCDGPDPYDFGDWEEEGKREITSRLGGTYYMKAVGVTYGNRQEVIKKLKRGDKLKFVPEPTNSYDRNAIMITTESGEQIGYISKEHNKSTLERMNQGVVYYPIVSEITGGDAYGYSYGVNIMVRYVFEG